MLDQKYLENCELKLSGFVPVLKFLFPLVKECKRLLIIPKAAARSDAAAGGFCEGWFCCRAANEVLTATALCAPLCVPPSAGGL